MRPVVNDARSRPHPRVSPEVSPAVRLGGPIFNETIDPIELARAHRRLGYRAAYCPKADVKDTPIVRAIEDAFRNQDVAIAEVGRWVNLLDADVAKRRANLETVTEGLALAEAVGALCAWTSPGRSTRTSGTVRIPTTFPTLLRRRGRERAGRSSTP